METTTWFPIATLVLGIALGHLLDWHKERRTESRERMARRRTFQRQAIMDAQDAVWESFRLSSEVPWAALEHLRAFGKWPSETEFQIDRAVAIPGLNTQARLAILSPRIDDQELRSVISSIATYPRRMTPGHDNASNDAAMDEFIGAIERLNTRARQLLADLY